METNGAKVQDQKLLRHSWLLRVLPYQCAKLFMEECLKRLIDQYQLIPHPEGGYYKEIYRSDHPARISD